MVAVTVNAPPAQAVTAAANSKVTETVTRSITLVFLICFSFFGLYTVALSRRTSVDERLLIAS
jgi:hypothetical protein